VSFGNSFVSKQPKLVSALSKTKVCFGCFALISKQGISVFRINRNKQKTNRNSSKFVKISNFIIYDLRFEPRKKFIVSRTTNKITFFGDFFSLLRFVLTKATRNFIYIR